MTKKQNIPLSTIISKCREQDPTAQRRLYDMYVLKLYNISYRILQSREDAEDAVMQAFKNAFGRINTYDIERGHIASWLSKICVNESLAIIKKRQVSFELMDDSLTIASSIPSKLEELEAEYIYKAMQKLSEQQRIIFDLYEIEGYSHREIAELLQMKESTCRAYLTRAKINLRDMLRNDHPNHTKIVSR